MCETNGGLLSLGSSYDRMGERGVTAMAEEAEYLTVRQVADDYGVTTATIYGWMEKGLISGVQKKGAPLLIDASTLDRVPRKRLVRRFEELQSVVESMLLKIRYLELIVERSHTQASGFQVPSHGEMVTWMREHGPARSTIQTWTEMPTQKYQALEWAIRTMPRQRKNWHQCDAYLEGRDPECPCSVLLASGALPEGTEEESTQDS